MDHDALEFSDVLDIKEEDIDEFVSEELIIADDEQHDGGSSEMIKEEILLEDVEIAEEVVKCVCRRCYATFNSINSLKAHLEICRFKELKCNQCTKVFFGLGNMRAHMYNTHKSKKSELTTSVTNKRFKSMNIQTPVRIVQCLFDCALCDKKFNSLDLLRQHRHSHFNETAITCKETKKTESRKNKVRTRWTQGDEVFLIELWSERVHKFERRNNERLYQDISTRFDSRPRQFTSQEVKFKIHNLSNKYRKEKRDFHVSGFPSQWDLFYQIDAFMNESKIKDFDLLAEDSIIEDDHPFNGSSLSTASDNRNSASPSPSDLDASDTADKSLNRSLLKPREDVPSTSRAAKRCKKIEDNNGMEKLLELVKTTDKKIKLEFNDIKKSDALFLEIEKERNQIFKKHVANMGRLTEEIVKLLRK